MRRALLLLLAALGCTPTTVIELPPTSARTAVWLNLRGVGAELHPTNGFAVPIDPPHSAVAQDLSSLEKGTRIYVALLGPSLSELHLDPGELRFGRCLGQSVDLRAAGSSMLKLVGGALSALSDEETAELAAAAPLAFYAARNDREAALCVLSADCPAVPSVQIPWIAGAPQGEQGGQVLMFAGLTDPQGQPGPRRVVFEQYPATPGCQVGDPCDLLPPELLVATRDPSASPNFADVQRFAAPRPANVGLFTAGRYLEPGVAVVAGALRQTSSIYLLRADPPGFEGPIATASASGPLSAVLARRGPGDAIDVWATSIRGALLHAEGGTLVEVVPRLRAPGRVDLPLYIAGALAFAADGAVLATGVGRPGDRRVVTTLDIRNATTDLVRVKGGAVSVEPMARYTGRDHSAALGVALYDHHGTPTEAVSGTVYNGEFDSSRLGVMFGPPSAGQPWPSFADRSIAPAFLGELKDIQPIEHGFVVVGSNFGATERGTIYRYDARRTIADPQAGAVECSGAGTSWFRVVVLGPNEWVTITTPKDNSNHQIIGARMAWWVER